MPWCETCSRFYNPNSLGPDGSCPTCGRVVADPPPEPGAGSDEAKPKERTPWHFKLLLVLVVVYLTYRFIQIGGWIVHWITH
ncbi:MAG TPA: hypothetical protein VKB57_14380 [Acidimicrobiales bacterium]|nr:hypothetical protein [Acidimicrobiales bacterium]